MVQKPRPSETLHVLVHPHFSLVYAHYFKIFGRKPGDFHAVSLRPVATKLLDKQSTPQAEIAVKVVETMHRFYRKQIELIARHSKDNLVILRDLDYPSGDELTDFMFGHEERLVAYARRKLGKRLTLLQVLPRDIGQELKRNVATQTKIRVFGEFTKVCCSIAAKSIGNAGFPNVEVVSSKSVS